MAKRDRIRKLAAEYGANLRTAALQFAAAPPTVSAIIPGASSGQQVSENIDSMKIKIPADFWTALKRENLIAENAPTPQ